MLQIYLLHRVDMKAMVMEMAKVMVMVMKLVY
jgi:hypothetical protein